MRTLQLRHGNFPSLNGSASVTAFDVEGCGSLVTGSGGPTVEDEATAAGGASDRPTIAEVAVVGEASDGPTVTDESSVAGEASVLTMTGSDDVDGCGS